MNKKQLIALWIGIAIIVLMGIFPPWIVTGQISGGNIRAFPKYNFILCAPRSFSDSPVSLYHIHTTQLLIQWSMVAVVTGGLLVTLRGNKKS